MRTLFFLLLFANLAFFAWAQGYFGSHRLEGREPQRLAAQLMPEKIHVSVAGPATAPLAAAAGLAANLCRLVAIQPIGDSERLKAALAKMAPEIQATLRPASEAQSYWVHIPPATSKQAADKRSAELKKLGVAEYYVVNDEGPDRWAVSLGLYRNEQAARDFIAMLSRKGVKDAKVKVRDKEANSAGLELRGPADKFTAEVTDFLSRQPAAVADCPQ